MKVKIKNKEIDSEKLSLLISFSHYLRIYAELDAYPHMTFYTNKETVEVKTNSNKRGKIIRVGVELEK
jgi:hypothetical protein